MNFSESLIKIQKERDVNLYLRAQHQYLVRDESVAKFLFYGSADRKVNDHRLGGIFFVNQFWPFFGNTYFSQRENVEKLVAFSTLCHNCFRQLAPDEFT